MNIEEKAVELIEQFKERFRLAANDVIGDAYCDILPHIEGDTAMNASTKAQQAVENILRGRVEHDGKYAVVRDSSGITMRIDLGGSMPHSILEALIKSMPECPKDRRIAALERENERLINERFTR